VYRLFEFASSLRKNYKVVTLESFTHIFLGDRNYYYACDPQLSQALTVDEKSASTLARHNCIVVKEKKLISYSYF
jgi:hypothetical protein